MKTVGERPSLPPALQTEIKATNADCDIVYKWSIFKWKMANALDCFLPALAASWQLRAARQTAALHFLAHVKLPLLTISESSLSDAINLQRSEMKTISKQEFDGTGRTPLSKLPDHLLVEIGSWLRTRRDLRALVLTSKRFHDIFEENLYRLDTNQLGYSKSLGHIVVKSDFVVANKIIKFGCNLDTRCGSITTSKEPITALVFALSRKLAPIVTILVAAGANVDKAPNAQHIPIFRALQYKWLDIFKLMVSVGNADLTILNDMGNGVLTEAARLGNLEATRYLLSIPSRLNPKGPEKSTPFHEAILNNNLALFSLLLGSPYTSPKTPCAEGRTPLQLACERRSLPFVRALLDDGRSNPQFTDNNINSLLVLQALRTNKDDLVMLLLTHKNPCKPSPMVFTETCKMSKELIAWKALEMLTPTTQQAYEWSNCAYKHGLYSLVEMMTQKFDLK